MRVCADARLLAKYRPSGIAEYALFLLEGLLAQKAEDEDFFIFYNGWRKSLLPLAWRGQSAIIEKRWPNRLFDLSARLFNQPRLEKLISADVYFSPHFNNLPLGDSGRRVITFHDLSFVHHPDFFSPRQHFWHWLQNYRGQVLTAGRLIAVSDFTKSDLVNYFSLPPEKVAAIYSGINPLYRPLAPADGNLAEFRKQRRLDRPFLFYLGSIELRKNIGLIIKAFNFLKEDPRLKDWRLFLAGAFGWGSNEILKEAARSAAAADIKFLGPINAEDALYFYNSAGVFVYPSFFEGFGFPPLEAQACGVPVVASNRSSLPEILGASALLVDPWRVGDLVSAVKEIVFNSSRKNGLIKAGAENVRRFNWEKTSAQTMRVLREVGIN